MATKRWLGRAAAVAKVITCTVGGTVEATDIFVLTINGKVLSVTAGSTVAATVASTIVTAWNLLSATVYPEFSEVTAAATSGGAFTLTMDTPGRDFAVTLTTTEADGSAADAQTFTQATSTANSGPKVWDMPANWDTGSIPVGACIPPVQSAATAVAGGSLTETTHYWVITATNANGETLVSNERSLLIVATDQTARLAWAQVTNATGYKIYRSTAAGTYGATSLVTTIASGSTLTYDDTGAALAAGTPPLTSTAIGDTVYLEYSDEDIRYGLDQSAITLTALYIQASFTGTLGNPDYNLDGAEYAEYRERYLKIGATTFQVGSGPGQGSGRIRVNNGTVQTALSVFGTGSALDTDQSAFTWLGTHASNTVSVFKGDFGAAILGGETSAIATLRVGYTDSQSGDVTVRCGSGVTLTTINQMGGTLEINSAATTINKTGGDLTVNGAGAITTLDQKAGSTLYRGTGTITNLRCVASAIDFAGNMLARVVTNMDVWAGASVNDPFRTVTWSNGIDLNQCGLGDVSLEIGKDVRVTPTNL